MTEKPKFQFQFGTQKQTKKDDKKEANIEDEEQSKEEIHTEVTEQEKVLFRQQLKSYMWDGSAWQERGEGDLVIAKCDQFTRVLLARLGTGKIALNFQVTKECKLGELKSSKDQIVTCTGVDYSDGEARPRVFAFRFKEVKVADEFRKLITDEGKYWDKQDKNKQEEKEKEAEKKE